MHERVNDLLVCLQVIISCGTLVTMLYAVGRFVNRPNVSQNNRLDAHDKQFRELDVRLNSMEQRLNSGSEHFKKLDKSIALTQSSLIVIMDSLAEIVPENSQSKEKLISKREDLLEYLTDSKD